jgi:hypothetical protein
MISISLVFFLFTFSLFLHSPVLRLSRSGQVVCYGLELRTLPSFANFKQDRSLSKYEYQRKYQNQDLWDDVSETNTLTTTLGSPSLAEPHWAGHKQGFEYGVVGNCSRHETGSRPDTSPTYVRENLFPQEKTIDSHSLTHKK